MLGDTARTAELMGGKKVLGRSIATTGEMRAAVEAGLPKAALEHVVKSIVREPIAQKKLMYTLVPEPTLRRRGRRLSSAESEKLERLARITALAQDLWGEQGDAREFMTTPHPLLEDKTPAEMTVTDLGAREVEDILRSLAFGLPI